MGHQAVEFVRAVGHGLIGPGIGLMMVAIIWLYRWATNRPPFELWREACWLGTIAVLIGLGAWLVGQTATSTITMMLVAVVCAAGFHSHCVLSPARKQKKR